ncbi:DUF4185 domain-containing protein, partial [Actinoallomurus vinaceus]
MSGNAVRAGDAARGKPMARVGPGSFIQSDFRSGGHGNFEAVIVTGTDLWHWWRDNSTDVQPWQRGQPIAENVAFPAAMIQSDYRSDDHGNFEVVVPLRQPDGRVRLWHFWHDNGSVTNPWQRGQPVTGDLDDVAGPPAMIQSDYRSDDHGNFEVVVPLRQPDGRVRLWHFWHDNGSVTNPWQRGQPVTPLGSEVTDGAALIQSDYLSDGHGNFEVVVPLRVYVSRSSFHTAAYHFWHDNSDVNNPWQPSLQTARPSITGDLDVVGSLSLIQSDFRSDGHGNFEMTAPVRLANDRTGLQHFWRDNSKHGEQQWRDGQFITQSCGGAGSLIHSDYGEGHHRNFEVIIDECTGVTVHYWHANDNTDYPWVRRTRFNNTVDIPRLGSAATKIAQLTGEYDRENWTGPPGDPPHALNQTETRWHITGTDLGVSFQHHDRTYFLFGDTWRNSFTGPNDDLDAIAYTTDATAEDGLDLTFLPQPPLVPGISQGGFEVPIDGLSYNNAMYVFFSTDHYQAQGRDLMGRTVLARSDDDGQSFTLLHEISRSHFINVSVSVVDATELGLDQHDGPQLVMFGSGRYRSSDVYLAYKPLNEIDTAGGWWYYRPFQLPTVELQWTDREEDAVPLFCSGNVGELSVRWNPIIKSWLCLHNENDGIQNRILAHWAARPMGPWSDAGVIFNLDDGLGRFIHSPGRDNTTHSFMENASDKYGDVYGPYQITRYSERHETAVRIYFTMSTWNPYQSMLMRTDLPLRTFADSLHSTSQTLSAQGHDADASVISGRAVQSYQQLGAAQYDQAQQLWGEGRQGDAVRTLLDRVEVYERLTEIDAAQFRPLLAQVLMDVCVHRRMEDIPIPEQAGQRSVQIYQELTGITDYNQLTTLTPNRYWHHPGLGEALYYLANAQWDAGHRTEATQNLQNRIKIYERLTQTDPTTYRPLLAQVLMDICVYRRIEDIPIPEQAGQRSVQIYQELTGITDYNQLTTLTPNRYWHHPGL